MTKSTGRPQLSHPEYSPEFKYTFLYPKHWLTWLGVFVLWLLMFTPSGFRNRMAALIVAVTVKPGSKRYRIVKANLTVCFSDKTESEIEK